MELLFLFWTIIVLIQRVRRFLLRGMEKVKIEWGLCSIAHNMRKMETLQGQYPLFLLSNPKRSQNPAHQTAARVFVGSAAAFVMAPFWYNNM